MAYTDDSGRLMDAATELARELGESRLYRAYREALARVGTNLALREKLEGYRKAHMEYQVAASAGNAPPLEDTKRISALYWELMLNDDARVFLESERELAALIGGMCGVIAGACDIELEMFD